jgi:IS5 family transposase
MNQARRRVLDGEKVPNADKLVSIFETHTDILVKGDRRQLLLPVSDN